MNPAVEWLEGRARCFELDAKALEDLITASPDARGNADRQARKIVLLALADELRDAARDAARELTQEAS